MDHGSDLPVRARSGVPDAEVEVTERLVRGLLRSQHPDLADRDLRFVASGWDNAVYRLGEDLCLRLPRRELGARLVLVEQRWLPVLAPRLPVPVPAPVRTGTGQGGYRWSWSICRWFDGVLLDAATPAAPAVVDQLAEFLVALHRPCPAGAPRNPYRSGPLSGFEPLVSQRIQAAGDGVDRPALDEVWRRARDTAPWAGDEVWVHGDLHPRNVLVSGDRLGAVLDFGDLGAGDPATDLVIAWTALDGDGRERLRDRLPHLDDRAWGRGRGWALLVALALVGAGSNAPAFGAVGRRALDALVADGP